MVFGDKMKSWQLALLYFIINCWFFDVKWHAQRYNNNMFHYWGSPITVRSSFSFHLLRV